MGKSLFTKDYVYISVFISLFMLWSACNGVWSLLVPTDEISGYHNALGEAFQHAQLSLLIEPSKELLSLANPYDPAQNANFRLHDASLFEGKYYLYFSPVPTIIAFLPFHLVTNRYLPEALLATIACLIGIFYLIRAAIFLYGEEKFNLFPRHTKNMLVIGFSILPGALYFLRRVLVYESTISVGFMFTSISFYLMLKIKKELMSKHGVVSNFRLTQLGASIGLMVWTRPNLIVYAVLFFIYTLFHIWQIDHNRIIRIIVLVASPLLIATLMFAYNYARFNSITEFGTSYILSGADIHGQPMFALRHIPIALFGYLLTMPSYSFLFPFVRLNPQTLPAPIDFNFSGEPLLGLAALPIFWILLGQAVKFSKKWLKQNIELVIAFIGSLGTLMILSLNLGTTGRYTLEFYPLFLLITYVVVIRAYALKISKDNQENTDYGGLIRALFCASVVIQFFASFTGYGDSFKRFSPNQFLYLESIFQAPLALINRILG